MTRLRNDKVFILTWAFVTNTVVFLFLVSRGPGPAPSVLGPAPASAPASASAPSEGAMIHLRDFGAARGLSFVAAGVDRPLGLPANDAALVDQLEGELEQARTALSALEE